MLSGKSPFKAATDYLIFQKIKNLEYTLPEEFSEESKDIVQKLLLSNPDERLGSEKTGGIEAIKNHPFFKGVDWDTIFTSNAPPLKERLEEELRKHPVPSPHFNFGQVDEDNEEEEELWLNQNNAPNPTTKAPSQLDVEVTPVKTTSPPHLNINTTVPKIITTDSKTSYRNSSLHAEDTMKTNSQMSSVASSVHSDIPDRSPVQPPPTW